MALTRLARGAENAKPIPHTHTHTHTHTLAGSSAQFPAKRVPSYRP